MTKKATIGTISEVTGLSLATVSRALSGSEAVLPETRDKVLAAAKKLNYVRDRAAVRLKTGKTWVVALIMDRRDVNQPAFKDLLLGLKKRDLWLLNRKNLKDLLWLKKKKKFLKDLFLETIILRLRCLPRYNMTKL